MPLLNFLQLLELKLLTLFQFLKLLFQVRVLIFLLLDAIVTFLNEKVTLLLHRLHLDINAFYLVIFHGDNQLSFLDVGDLDLRHY